MTDLRRYMITAHRDERAHYWRDEKKVDRAEQHIIRWPLTYAEAATTLAGFYVDDQTKDRYDTGWDDIEIVELQPALPGETADAYRERVQDCRWEIEDAARELAQPIIAERAHAEHARQEAARVAAERAAAAQRVSTETAERAKLAELLARYGHP